MNTIRHHAESLLELLAFIAVTVVVVLLVGHIDEDLGD